VLTIAVGVGANAANLQHRERGAAAAAAFLQADDLVLVTDVNTQTKQNTFDAAPANFLDWRVRTRSLTALAAFRQATFALSGDRPESFAGAIVNANFFDVLEVKPALGRGLDLRRRRARGAARGRTERRHLAQRFGASAGVIGVTVRLN